MTKKNTQQNNMVSVDTNGVGESDVSSFDKNINITNEEKSVILLEESACLETLNNFSDFNGLLSKGASRSANFTIDLSFGISVANLAAFSTKYVDIALQSKDGSTFLFKQSKNFNFPKSYRDAQDRERYIYLVFWKLFIAYFGITCLFLLNKSDRGISFRETVSQISAFGLPYGLWSYINLLVHPNVTYSLGKDRGVFMKRFSPDAPSDYFGVNDFIKTVYDEEFSKGMFTRLFSALTFMSGLHSAIKLDTLFYTSEDAACPSVIGAGEVFFTQDKDKNFYINSLVSHGRLTSARISFCVLFDIRLKGTARFKQYSLNDLQLGQLESLNLLYHSSGPDQIKYFNVTDSLSIPTPVSGSVTVLPSTVDINKYDVFAITNYILISGSNDLLLNSCWFVMTGDTISMTFSPLFNGDPNTQSIGLSGRDSTIKEYASEALKSHGIDLEDMVETGKNIILSHAINMGVGAVLNKTPVGRVVGLVTRAQGVLPPRLGNTRR